MLNTTKLLGINITNESADTILEYLFISLEKAEKYYIVTPNPEILTYSFDHPAYKKILNGARIALPDGVGVFIASGLMGNRLRQRITGVDFMEEICKRTAGRAINIGFLGGGRGIAKRTAECLREKYPWLNVVFAREEWPAAEIKSYTSSDTSHSIDILFVAFGHPKQEEWINKNLAKIPVKIAMGVGGAFDYISKEVPRAPFMIRAVGLEWLYRLIRQPWRWKRQLALFRFIYLIITDGIKRLLRENPL